MHLFHGFFFLFAVAAADAGRLKLKLSFTFSTRSKASQQTNSIKLHNNWIFIIEKSLREIYLKLL